MKTQKENRQGLYLQKKNNRWKWMAGATAATAAGGAASQAALITVSLSNNYISSLGNHLNPDLTGDGHPDLVIQGAAYFYHVATYNGYPNYSDVRVYAAVDLNGVHAQVYGTNRTIVETYMQLGSRYAHHYNQSYGTPSLTGSIPIFFKDLHINGGAPTAGSLDVRVSGYGVQLDSLTYNDPHTARATTRTGAAVLTVPEQGSSLALLAMGASGVLALRRWRAAQGRS